MQLYASTKTHFKYNNISTLKLKFKNIYHVSTDQKKTGMALLKSEKVNLKANLYNTETKKEIK